MKILKGTNNIFCALKQNIVSEGCVHCKKQNLRCKYPKSRHACFFYLTSCIFLPGSLYVGQFHFIQAVLIFIIWVFSMCADEIQSVCKLLTKLVNKKLWHGLTEWVISATGYTCEMGVALAIKGLLPGALPCGAGLYDHIQLFRRLVL